MDDPDDVCQNRFGFDLTAAGSAGCPADLVCHYDACPMYYFKVRKSATGSHTWFTHDNNRTYNQ